MAEPIFSYLTISQWRRTSNAHKTLRLLSRYGRFSMETIHSNMFLIFNSKSQIEPVSSQLHFLLRCLVESKQLRTENIKAHIYLASLWVNCYTLFKVLLRFSSLKCDHFDTFFFCYQSVPVINCNKRENFPTKLHTQKMKINEQVSTNDTVFPAQFKWINWTLSDTKKVFVH